MIRRWLSRHWKEAERIFEEYQGAPGDDFPKLMVSYGHVYTQYKKMKEEKTREYMSSHPKVVSEVRNGKAN